MTLQNKYKTVGGIVRPVDYQEPVFLRTPEGTAAGRELEQPILPATPPQIGDVVLFSIGPNTFRPLLVVSLREMGKVCGTLFVDPLLDSSSPWIHKNSFSKPQKSAPYVYVEGVKYGEGLGEWRKKETVETVSFRGLPLTMQQSLNEVASNPDPRATE